MKLFEKAKAAAEQAATMAKEGVEEVQTKRELHGAFGELGAKTFELVAAGSLAHPELTELVGRIRALQEKLAAEEQPAAEAPAEPEPSAETPPPPPAAPAP